MGVCATPDCGVHGRPFPPCDYCHSRLYCGSHCLISLAEEFWLKMEKKKNANLLSEEELDKMKRTCAVVCPPCYQRFMEGIEGIEGIEQDQQEQEEQEPEEAEAAEDDAKA